MTGTGLITWLRDLKYEKANQLRSAQFNVICTDRNLRRFFDFLISNIGKENFVNSEELKKFAQLKSEGRLVVDRNERLKWIEKKQKTSNQENKAIGDLENRDRLEWSKKRLETARRRLDHLRKFEERLLKINRQQLEIEEDRTGVRDRLLTKQKNRLKQTQIELIGMDMEYQHTSERLTTTLDQMKTFALNRTILASLFFTSTAAARCISSIRQNMVQCYDDQKSLQISINGGRPNDQEEINRLCDSISLAIFDRFIQEMQLAGAKMKLARIRELQNHLANKSMENGCQSANSQSDSIKIDTTRDKIQGYLDNILKRDVKLEVEIRITKSLRDDYRQKIGEVNEMMMNKNQALLNLRKQIGCLNALKLLISEERLHVNENGQQSILGVQNGLDDRKRQTDEVKNRMESILLDKRKLAAASRREGARSAASVRFDEPVNEIFDAKCVKIILKLVVRNDQILIQNRQIAQGTPELTENILKSNERLESLEKRLSIFIKEYEKRKGD